GCSQEVEPENKLPEEKPTTESYVPGNLDYLEDTKVQVLRVEGENFQPGAEPKNMIDGNLKTGYHSKWDVSSTDYWPITLDFYFKDVSQIDCLKYYPRLEGSNGLFKEVEIWTATKANPQLVKNMNFDFGGVSSPTKVNFSNSLLNPIQIRIIVKSGVNNLAQCSEM
ncbi:MAG: discoidin domain-containing protein, partial [Bacteroidales bacterium]